MSKLRENGDDPQIVRSYALEDLQTGKLTTRCDDKGCLVIPASPAPGDNPGQIGTNRSGAEIDREAHESGFEQGRRDGLELGRKEMADKIQELDDILRELSGYKARICAETEAQLLELTLALAEVIIRHEVQCRPEVVQETLRAALDLVAESSKLKVCLHPEDLENIQQFLPQLEQQLGSATRLELEGDPAAPRGGCLVEADCGIIDTRLKEQLEVLKEQLRQTLQQRQQAK